MIKLPSDGRRKTETVRYTIDTTDKITGHHFRPSDPLIIKIEFD